MPAWHPSIGGLPNKRNRVFGLAFRTNSAEPLPFRKVLLRPGPPYTDEREIESQHRCVHSAVIPLPLLRPDEAAVIRDIAGSDADVTRLAEMGFASGPSSVWSNPDSRV